MLLWPFIAPLDRRAVLRHLGSVLRLLALLLLLPAVTAVAVGELPQAIAFAATSLAAGAAGWLAGRGGLPDLKPRDAIVVTALAYPLAALVGLPAFLTVAWPVDAMFESMSGFTTTGLTLMDEPALPVSPQFFRAYSQWLGGLGIIVLSLVALAGAGSAAAKLYSSEFGERNIMGSVLAMGRVVAIIYSGLTVAAVAALGAAGAGWPDAVFHALALVSTGRFSSFSEGIGAYDSAAVAGVTVAFMLLAALSVPLYYVAWRVGWRRVVGDAQLRLLLVLVLAGTAVAVAFEGWGDSGGLEALFHITSAATTTGFTLSDPVDWTEGTRLLAIGHMFVGGATGSTAGASSCCASSCCCCSPVGQSRARCCRARRRYRYGSNTSPSPRRTCAAPSRCS